MDVFEFIANNAPESVNLAVLVWVIIRQQKMLENED